VAKGGLPPRSTSPGRVRGTFGYVPFSPAERQGSYDQYFVQHFDLLCDSREELLINSSRAIWCYTNGTAARPDLSASQRNAEPRIYNASFYVGQQ
jgi:hypothetical protein